MHMCVCLVILCMHACTIHTSRFLCEGCFKESGAPGDVTGETATRTVEEINNFAVYTRFYAFIE